MKTVLMLVCVLVLSLMLFGCADTLAIFGSSETFTRLAEEGENIGDAALEKSASGYEKYCRTIPETARAVVRTRFNSHTTEFDMPAWCVPKVAE